jgi:nucleotide-binding universal stress UspA family protein
MFTKIVVATDFSEASDSVIGCLHGLKPLGVQEVILMHALGLRHLEELKYLLAPQAERKLQDQKAELVDQGFQVTVRIEPGLPAAEINRVARETKASMIVVGSHGATLSREVLLGSVATEVLHRSRHPVLVARLKIHDTVDDRTRCEMVCTDFHRHVLFATDFSDTAERAFGYVEKIVESGGRRVTLLHVQDRSHIEHHLLDRLDEFNRIDEERLARMRARLQELGADDVRIELPYGHPVDEIVERAAGEDATLIVMGSQGRGVLAAMVLGGVSLRVTRLTSVPVLVVPPIRSSQRP